MTTYRVISGDSVVGIHARSSLHAIDGHAGDVSGTVDLEVVDGIVRRLLAGHLEVPVSSLRSGNVLEDAELQRRVDARRFPTIVGEVQSAEVLELLDDGGRFRVDGDLTFHGVTRPVTGELRITREGGAGERDRVRVEGEQVFDVREFGVNPPRILLLRVEPEVRVDISLSLDVHLERA